MAYKRKTRDTWEVQGNYGYGHGWECVTGADTYAEARTHLREYRENEPGTPFRIKLVRERIETPAEMAKPQTYKIVRFRDGGGKRTLRRGLTLEEAQAHCSDPETSSATAKRPGRGVWFDGFQRETA